MTTQKLYYQDSHMMAFDARVLACEQTPKGWEIVLDATAFFPEGGGQASDTGTLGDVHVLSSKETGETVVHLCDGELAVGARVHGCVDAEPRMIRMQMHSGEHIVSGLIHKRFGYHNVGFHMNLERIVIDFDGALPEEAIAEIEEEANRAVWRNIPLHIWTPAEEELPGVNYRTKRALPWPVRIVEVPGYDTCACCGTHVKTTGEIGLIKIFSAVPFRGGTRMELACGLAALREINTLFVQNRQVSRLLSVPQKETGAGAQAILKQLEQTKFTVVKLRAEQAQRIADSFAGKGDSIYFAESMDGNALRELTEAIVGKCGGKACVFSKTSDGFNYCVADRTGNVQPLCKAMNAALNGRGGGKSGFCQGTVKADEEKIRAFLKENTNLSV